MACPFTVEEPIDMGAQIIRQAFQLPAPRIFRDRTNPLAFSDEYLWERYRLTRPSIVYLTCLLDPQIRKRSLRSQALTTMQSLCVPCVLASGSFIYTVGDAEGL